MASIRALALESFETEPAVIEIAAPKPAAGEVLVRVRAASVNFYDTIVAMGGMKDYLPYEFPAVIGQDLAGVVESVGDGVTGLAAGDRVFGSLGSKPVIHDGTFGELATPTAGSLVPTPDGLSDKQAGTLGVAGSTAMSAIDALGLSEGATVLVLGATGGVGAFAVQIGAVRGASVIASVRPGDEDFVRGLGAAETVDYTGDLAAEVAARWPDGVDALVDVVNRDQAAFAAAAGLVRAGGTAVSAVGGAGESTRAGEVTVANIGGDPAKLPALADLIVAGRVRAAISHTYPFDDAAQALRDFTQEHTLGKFLISLG